MAELPKDEPEACPAFSLDASWSDRTISSQTAFSGTVRHKRRMLPIVYLLHYADDGGDVNRRSSGNQRCDQEGHGRMIAGCSEKAQEIDRRVLLLTDK